MLHKLYQQHLVIGNSIVLLLQGRLRSYGILKDRFIVAEGTGGSIHLYAHHLELIVQCLELLNRCLHSNKLRAKGTGLYRVSSLTTPDYGHVLHINDDACVGPLGLMASSVVSINKAYHMHFLTT